MLEWRCYLATVLLFAVFPHHTAPAQTPPAVSNPPEISTRDAPTRFRTGTNVVLIPVVARDRQGRGVGTLRREDFQIRDAGKPQSLTSFSLESSASTSDLESPNAGHTSGAAAAASALEDAPRRFVAYFFDDIHLETGDLERARAAVESHIAESLDPADRAAIYTSSGGLTLEFTDDRNQLRKTLEQLQRHTSTVYSPSDCPHVDFYMADLIVNKNDRQAFNVAVNDTLACMVPNTRELPAAAIEAARSGAISAAQRVLRAGDAETRQTLSALDTLVLRMAAAPGSRNIVLISSGFLLPIDDRINETGIMERAIRSNVTINSLDARGLFGVAGADASQPTMNGGQAEFRTKYESAAAFIAADTMAELADATGGQFFHNGNDLRQGLDLLAAQPEFRYVLGFVPEALKNDGRFHRIQVSLRNPAGLTIQARRGYYAPGPRSNGDNEEAEQLVEAMFSRAAIGDIPLALNLRYRKTAEFKAVLSVVTSIDAKTIRFRADQGRHHDDLTVAAGVFDRNGNLISGSQKIVEMHLRDETLEALSASGIRMRNTFDLTSGSYRVRVVARDSEGRMMGAAEDAIQIP
jgi:VWFA-related protein